MSTDRELLELAAKAASYRCYRHGEIIAFEVKVDPMGPWIAWNPITDYVDRYRLAQKLGLAIDFTDCTVWKRLSDHALIQEFWGGDSGDEAHAIVRAAAAIGRAMP